MLGTTTSGAGTGFGWTLRAGASAQTVRRAYSARVSSGSRPGYPSGVQRGPHASFDGRPCTCSPAEVVEEGGGAEVGLGAAGAQQQNPVEPVQDLRRWLVDRAEHGRVPRHGHEAVHDVERGRCVEPGGRLRYDQHSVRI